MNAEKTSDDGQKRLGRLKAMQTKHAATPAAAAAPMAKPGPQGGAGGAAAGGIQAKLRKALAGPDGKIDQKKARMFLMMIRKQAADPAAPRHEMALKIAEKIKSMPAQQRQRLMAKAGLGGAGLGGAGLGGAGLGGAGLGGAGLGGAGLGGAGLGAGKGRGAARQPAEAAQAEPTGEAWFDNLVDKL